MLIIFVAVGICVVGMTKIHLMIGRAIVHSVVKTCKFCQYNL